MCDVDVGRRMVFGPEERREKEEREENRENEREETESLHQVRIKYYIFFL